MLKFFRNIRKKLASENKVASYLRYAIGEIILVVIGILIALQVNNWNEQRKSNEKFNDYTFPNGKLDSLKIFFDTLTLSINSKWVMNGFQWKISK